MDQLAGAVHEVNDDPNLDGLLDRIRSHCTPQKVSHVAPVAVPETTKPSHWSKRLARHAGRGTYMACPDD